MNEEIIKVIFGEITNRLNNHLCPICGQKIDESDFRDEISKREYGISGMCQQCQDKIFNKE